MLKTKEEQVEILNTKCYKILVHILELNSKIEHSLIAPLKESRKSCLEMAQILGELNATRQQT